MAGKSSIVKKDAKTRRAIKQGLIEGVPERAIANQSGATKSAIHRYKAKVQKEIAEAWTEQKKDSATDYEEQFSAIATRLNKTLDAIDRELTDINGDYDLSNAERAYPYIKMLNDTSRSLQSNIMGLAKITGDMKEIAEINSRPTLMVMQISQIIQTLDIKDREVILDRLRVIADS